MTELTEGPQIASFWATLQRRKVVQWGVAYAAGAWGFLQGLEYVADTFGWPVRLQQLATLALLCGLPIVLVLAWYHGDKGQQRVTATELTIVTLLFVIGGAVFWRYGNRDEPAGEPGEVVVAGARPTGANESLADRESSGEEQRPSVAVLPFLNLSSDPEQEYFADGLTEQIIDSLARLPDLLVTARTSSFATKGSRDDIPTLASRLGVGHVVEGSVRRIDNRVRVSAQLIRANDGFHLWSQTYDRELTDVFAVQDDIAVSVAEALEVALDSDSRARMQAAGVRSVEAYIHYRRGRELFTQAHESDQLVPALELANTQLARAYELAPELSAARFMMSDLYAHKIWEFERPREERERTLQILRETLDEVYRAEADPDRRALINVDRRLFESDWRGLREVFADALRGRSCFTPNYLELSPIAGLAKESLEFNNRLLQCDPLDAMTRALVGVDAIWAGKHEEALEHAKVAMSLGADAWGSSALFRAYLAMGRFDEAQRALRDIPPESSIFGESGVVLLAAQGELDAARKVYAGFRQEQGPDLLKGLPFHAMVGDRVEANRIAAEIDAEPAGPWILMELTHICMCGAPFDIEVTPVFRARAEAAGIAWPPASPIHFPAKTY